MRGPQRGPFPFPVQRKDGETMPRVKLMDPWGMPFTIDTMNRDLLRQWFDEHLPVVNADIDTPDVGPAQIWVSPMFKPELGRVGEPDWLADSRVISQWYPFPALNGEEGLSALDGLRHLLADDLEKIKQERGEDA